MPRNGNVHRAKRYMHTIMYQVAARCLGISIICVRDEYIFTQKEAPIHHKIPIQS
jgi:hypothetical protein